MGKKEKAKKNSIFSTFFTAEVFGMALTLFCVLILLRLIAGDLLFGTIGEKIGKFFFGVFGYFSFPLLVYCAFLGMKLLIGFKVQNKQLKRVVKYLVLYALLICLILQTALSPIILPISEYLDYCYASGITLANCTAGGVVLGAVANYVVQFMSQIGAYLLYSLLLALTTTVLFREKISALLIKSREAKAQKPKKDKNVAKKEMKEDVAEEQSKASPAFEFNHAESTEEQEQKPSRSIVFGGGAFEKKDPKDKNSASAGGVHLLFGGNAFTSKTNSNSYTTPITTEKSYRERYDEDIERKTDFVRRPYDGNTSNYSDQSQTVISPMGNREERLETPFFNSGKTHQMDIDVSEPEKNVYVFNRGGRTRENISPFDRQVNGERSENANNYSSFNPSQDRMGERTQSSYSTNSDNDYNKDRFTSFDRIEQSDRTSPNSFNSITSFESNSRFERTNSLEDRNGGFSGENSRINADRFNSNNDFSRGNDREFYNSSRMENADRIKDFEQDRSSGSIDSRFDGYNSRTKENPFTQEDKGFERGEQARALDAFSAPERREIEEPERRINPLTQAMQETQNQVSKPKAENNNFENDFSFNEGINREEETPDYNGDGGTFAGSFFAAQDRTREKHVIHKDRAHYTLPEKENKPESQPTVKPAASTSSSYSTNTNSVVSGRQITMDNIPDENKLINPIDNIPKNYKYAFPPITLLKDYLPDEAEKKRNEQEQKYRADMILTTLKTANIEPKIEDIKFGPSITRFELSIPPTVPVKRLLEKQDDLNLWLAARDKIRIIAPIQGTSRIGIEVPNSKSETVGVKTLISSKEFSTAKQSTLSFCMGKDIVGRPVILDIAKMPHLLVAGATGTGKSVFLNTLLISLIYKYSPEELRIILVDPKVVEFSIFRGIPNLMFNEIFTNNAKVCSMLEWAVQEMEERYVKLNDVLAKNIDEYNSYIEKKKGKKMPKILIIIDEFADLMNSSSERKLMENKISRLAAKARAAGIHLIMATQRPSADIMEGSIKTNFTSRIAFKMASPTDAMVIMGEGGADKLLGMGDSLFRTSNMPSAERAQGSYVSTEEIEMVTKYIKEHNECYYDEFALEKINKGAQSEEAHGGDYIPASGDSQPAKTDEELVKKAMRLAINANNLSISGLQRKLGIGFPKAGKLIDSLVEKGYISESIDNKTRKIFMTKEQFEETFGEPL